MSEKIIKLFTENGKVYATSREVAKDFEKEHYNVTRDIENLLKIDPLKNEGLKYFIPCTYIHRGNEYKQYKLTKDGFTLLAMGFTGSRAIQFKIDYIHKFNEMELQLQEIDNVMNTKGELSEDEYAEVKFSTAYRVKNTFLDSSDIFKDYERFTVYSRKTMDTKKRVKRLNQIIEALKTREDNLYINKTKGYRAERENIIELKEEILRDINELNNRSYGQKLGYANRKVM
ncbi:Rha family phage regulatory protein [Clostridium beijerinckii]|uniref:Rha family transcriptional regulator n=1 Tax=Clostridium beijerinckii TaxID=1520 RepID=UPI00156D7068|nr:Rha family transcriptional regulator [Clostridium beijerinckii]NRT32630.1 Rha family phage regulatory protein [Clostridium beijerinckii]NRT47942.1 Rha family phage regulatory protein [Clostridium beijerinckii]NRZ23762.1 Rha family phage regulatory protein [Clostridium beijerinckii]